MSWDLSLVGRGPGEDWLPDWKLVYTTKHKILMASPWLFWYSSIRCTWELFAVYHFDAYFYVLLYMSLEVHNTHLLSLTLQVLWYSWNLVEQIVWHYLPIRCKEAILSAVNLGEELHWLFAQYCVCRWLDTSKFYGIGRHWWLSIFFCVYETET